MMTKMGECFRLYWATGAMGGGVPVEINDGETVYALDPDEPVPADAVDVVMAGISYKANPATGGLYARWVRDGIGDPEAKP